MKPDSIRGAAVARGGIHRCRADAGGDAATTGTASTTITTAGIAAGHAAATG